MSLAKTIVSRPTTLFIIFVLLLGLGGFALLNLPIDLTPDVSFPYVMVSTTYTGAGPEEVERSISRPLEAALSSVSNLKQIDSTSSKGSSMVSLEFNYGTDLADATNSIRDALDRVRRYLPDGADSPTIFKFDPSMMPVMGLMVTSENRSPENLRELANDSIVPRLEQIPGVATASVNGGRDKQIRVEIQSSRLEAYGLTVTQLQQMLSSQNAQVAAGSITENGVSYILNTMGEYKTLEEIRNTVIYYAPNNGVNGANGRQGQPIEIFLRDIADVREGYADQQSLVYVNGQEAVQLSVQKQSGQNSVQVAKDIRKRLVKLAGELPGDVKITEIFNTTDIIEDSLNNVTSSAVSGAVLAVLILFLFLRSIKPTVIIGISIPVSIIITLMLMYFWGLTLNLMTLAGLFLGVGMLVDNSIVILENIYHYREKGAKLVPAAILGTEEMIVAITCSTLTTLCVFLPLVMFQSLLEMAGEMFAGLAFTVVFSLAISLFVAIFLVPVLSSHYLPLLTRKQAPLKGKIAAIDGCFERFLLGMEGGYRKLVAKVLRHKLIVVGFLFILFIGSIAAVPKIGWIYMPESAADSVSINVTMPLGTALPETEKTLKEIEAIIKKELTKDGAPAYDRIILNAGGGGRFSGGGTNSGSLRINLPEFDKQIMNADEIQAVIRPYFNQFPGVRFRFSSGGGMMGGGGGNPIDIVLHTENLVKGKAMADRISGLLKEKIPDVTEPQVSLNDGLPQIEIELNRERMYALGLNAYMVGNEIKAAVDGITASQFKSGNDDLDIILILAEADRSSLPALDHIFVRSSVTGARVPLSNFAAYKEGTGPMTISRESQSRVIHVTSGVKPGTKLNEVEARIQNMVKSEIPAEDDVIITYAGDNSEMVKMFVNFLLIMVVAVALVFGVMASLFESFRDPFIIIFTIPLSFIGVVAIYAITGDRFNILTAVGILVLLGVIVNNGIVLVDYTNLLRKRGYGLEEACIEAAGNRLRPIMMSTLTTVLGLAPMAFFPGEGSELVAPIGKTVFGGLTFGTFMTLFLMPAIYAKINKHDDERRAIAGMKREGIASGLSKADLKNLIRQKKAEQHANEKKIAEAAKKTES
ncbi:MAG: efflux RND transporter permease subunit [Spirochaetaceae bacterium]|jgi:HAE1 family hydrophobic/amphiphilic exporter-1|nr:efflux RND transporter permease subunit [Spirochaetaceae bacterium]